MKKLFNIFKKIKCHIKKWQKLFTCAKGIEEAEF